jgi:hypothetical protein
MPPNQPLQRTRTAPRDRYYFTASLRAEPCFDLDGAPLNGRALGVIYSSFETEHGYQELRNRRRFLRR